MWLRVCLLLSAMVTSWGHIREMDPRWRDSCPQIYLSEFKSYAPIGNETSGVFAKKATIHTIEDCIADCCDDKMCNIIFMHNTECFQISCYTNEACIPLYRPEAIFTIMVLVSPLPPADSWEEVVSVPQEDDNYPVSDIMEVAESNYIYTSGHHTCEDGVLIDCPLHESCVTVAKHSRNGLCHCDQGYNRNASGVCVLMDKWKKGPETRMFVGKKLPFTESSSEPNKMFSEGELGGKTDVAIVEVSSVRPLKQLVVSAISKEVRLPENAVTLSAYTVPAEQPDHRGRLTIGLGISKVYFRRNDPHLLEASLGNLLVKKKPLSTPSQDLNPDADINSVFLSLGEHYNYEWTLVSQPEGGNSGTMNDQNGGTLKLSNLIEGLYTFKVSVSSPGAYGETLANVTVLPPKRINQIPVAIISPSSQTVKLPNTGAVLDGSTSRDDDSIIGWHWELQQGPLGYQPHLVDTPTLQLDNLVMPGNYTFKLTVEDSDHATNFTTANITVLKVTDYPPEANAGQDIIVYLPKNNLTLNGNLSTDDRLIASWEWTKSPSDQNKAVDMQMAAAHSEEEQKKLQVESEIHHRKAEKAYNTLANAVKDAQENPNLIAPFEEMEGHFIELAPVDNQIYKHPNLKISECRWIQFSKDSPTEIRTRKCHSILDALRVFNVLKKKGKTTNVDNLYRKVQLSELNNLYPGPKLPINSAKKADLVKISEYLPPEHRAFYLSLTCANTRTPYLQLSNLEKGIYTFVLKVTDSSGQSSSAEVHVFVKPPTNTPPVADAGQDLAVALPQTSVLLNGSHSSDDNKIVAWLWQQNSGPSKVSFSAINSSQTNVTDLTKGDYEFQLTVTDDSGNKASDVVHVTVTQNKNARPKANGGGDQTVVLPVSVVVLNGSQSSDDLGIVHWQWTREGSSLALGKVVGETDTSPVLMLTDVVPGRYVFRLHVSDDQGLGDEDTVSIIVKPDPHILHLVELTLNIEGSMLTQSQQESLEAKLALLLQDEAAIHIQETRVEERTRHAVIVFYVDQKGGKTVLSGPAVVKRLKEKLRQDSGLLELSVANIQTAVCQNNCSGHGVCDQASRQCLCEAFWMQDLISKYLRDGDSNCDWSILYVIILLFIGVLLIVGGVWGMVCVFQRSCVRRPRKRQKYALLDEEEDVAMIPPLTHKIVLSETDSDSDVLFESRKCKANGDARNGHNKLRNGFAKIGRRIKT
uniref:PKD domain-containing protein n=1 Tax=Timema monikensis TaxID=170555 RepID=A0A7R9HP71_9NEOP|nr:unnamed protein product [Timema monikensis]